MKQRIFITFLVSILYFNVYALDHIILRNGEEYDVKLQQITDEMVTYALNVKKHVAIESIPTKDVYMVSIENQGNLYLTQDGKRISGETSRVDRRKYDVIYLVSGGEIGAKSILLTEGEIKYAPVKKSSLLANLLGASEIDGVQTLPNHEVFMIRYKSGMKDIVTPIEKTEPEEQLIEEEPQISQYKVLFHAVTKGQNLKTIAEEYNVTVTQIIEWNDLPAKSKPETPLTVGMQLMIYQPIIDKK